MRFAMMCFIFMLSPCLSAQTLSIGTVPYDPPFEMTLDMKGHLTGFEIELMNALCKQMQVECQYKLMDFDKLFDALKADDVQLIIQNITITPKRREQYLFSDSYLDSSAGFIAMRKTGITNLSMIKGKKIGVLKGSVYIKTVLRPYDKTNKIIEYPTADDFLQALSNGEVDLVLDERLFVLYLVANSNNLFQVVGPAISEGQGYGIVATKNSDSLMVKINNALKQLKDNGAYLKIYNRYFGFDV